jgi:hypothetical protein
VYGGLVCSIPIAGNPLRAGSKDGGRIPIRRRYSRQLQRGPGFDAVKIALFLLDPHPKIPDMSLTCLEAIDLAAYIGSLGKQRL